MSTQPSIGQLLGDWSLEPALCAALALSGGLYAGALARLRRRGREGWPAWRAACFAAGLLTIAIALQSGLDRSADTELLSLHVVQHLLLGLLAPVFLLCGAPLRLALATGTRGVRAALAATLSSRAVALLARPLTGALLFASVMLITYVPAVTDAALEQPALHALEHGAYFWSGVVLLAPLIAAEPLAHPPGALARFGWLMVAMTAMSIPGALLTFSESVSYPFYLAPAHALGRSALADEHTAGVIMWVGGGIALFALALALACVAMLEEERRQRRRELYLHEPVLDGWDSGRARG